MLYSECLDSIIAASAPSYGSPAKLQAYISPPITAVFYLGSSGDESYGQGAFAALIVGFVLGAIRFVLEVGFGGAMPSAFSAGTLG